MFYPKELFVKDEKQTARNLAAYDREQERVYNECRKRYPNWRNMGILEQSIAREVVQGKDITASLEMLRRIKARRKKRTERRENNENED